MIQVEICTPGRQSAINAKSAGAYRIELCENLEIGGTSPTIADVEFCSRQLQLRTHVLVRPRGGDFCYSDEEFLEILSYIGQCRDAGAHAVVFGFLKSDYTIDVERTRRAVDASSGMEVTFHRAFDRVPDQFSALELVIGCGCHRILTSGGKPTALEGVNNLRRLVEQSDGRIAILAGSGVTPGNAVEILTRTGVNELHGSCKSTLSDGTIATDADCVRSLLSKVANL